MSEWVRRIFSALVNTIRITIGVLPTSADTVAAAAVQLTAAAGVWTWGAWAQIVAAAAVDQQVTGVSLENFVGALAQGEVQIGTGAGGFEAAIITVPITAPYFSLGNSGPFVTAGVRVAARYRTSTGAADNVSVKLVTRLGI